MGHEYNFRVRSNTTWEITGATTELPQLFMNTNGQDFTSVLNTTGGNDKKDGNQFTVQVETPALNSSLQLYGIGRAGRKMKLTFTDDAGIAPPLTKTFIAVTQDPNSYRVRNGGGNYTGGNLPGSYGKITFPIRKLFWAWEADLETELNPATSGPLNLSAELIWQTSAGLIQSGAFEFKDEGGQNDWRDYCVSLWSDNRQNTRDLLGNALIAIKNGNEILWSFHIWVTDYFPDNTPAMGKTFTNTAAGINPAPVHMDYNLGATISYTQFDPHQSVVAEPIVSPAIGGLYYQFGRKDPIPGPRQLSTAGTHTLNENNQLSVVNTNNQRVYTTFQTVSEPKNLRNSIQNPTIYYTGVAGLNDWYTTSISRTDQNDFLWTDKEGMKGLYDPCPVGWKIGKNSPSDYANLGDYYSFTPNRGTWANLTNTNRFYLPSTGYLRNPSGSSGTYAELRNYMTGGYLFDSQIVDGEALGVRDDNEELNISWLVYRAAARPVRCVQDTHNWNSKHY